MVEMANVRETSPARSAYVVALLTAVYFFYLVDRNALVVSQELIKQEFRLSDSAMGLMTGTLYGFAYAAAGIPLGWAVDRVNRKKLLAIVVAAWSGLTALCGFSTSYTTLAAIRVGVGAAEAGGSPAALSILSDMFPPEKRGRVSSIFYSGASLGAIGSILFGSYVAMHYGWRTLFVACGLPGIGLALLIYATLREPRRTAPADADDSAPAGMVAGTITLLRHPGLSRLYIATAIYMLSVSGVGTWLIPYFMRTHHLDLATVGLYVGLGSGVFGVFGMVSMGIVFDWARRFGPRGPLCTVAAAIVFHVACGIAVLLSDSLFWAVVALCGMGATTTINAGPTGAAISETAPPRMRGLAFGVYAVVANIVGAGLGPLAVGLLSDLLGGGAALGTAMLIVLVAQLGAAVAFVWASARAGTGWNDARIENGNERR